MRQCRRHRGAAAPLVGLVLGSVLRPGHTSPRSDAEADEDQVVHLEAVPPEEGSGDLAVPPPPLAWPAICQPLFEQQEGTDYPWAQRCRGYSYGGSDHQDALLCGVGETRWHQALLCELFRIATDCVDRPCAAGRGASAESLRAGLRRGQAALPRDAGEVVEVLLVGAAPQVADAAPDGELSFETFASMFAVAALCLGPQPEHVQRIYHLRPQALGREGCRDLVVEHFEHLFEALDAGGVAPPTPPRTAPRSGSAAADKRLANAVRKHIMGLLPEGPLGVADAEPAGRGHYAALPADEPWARFVVRAPRHGGDAGADRWLELQEAWGWQNAWAAVRLAGRLDELLAGETPLAESLDAWLEALGAERGGMLDGREAVEGQQRQVGYRRWRASQRTLTPISGQYRPMWRAALLRRAAEAGGAAELFRLPVPAGATAAAADARAWRCGAVLTWVDLGMSCAEAEAEGAEPEERGELGNRGGAPGSSLVPQPGGGGCRLLLNRAILRSAGDAAALGLDDCESWFGLPVAMHNASYAIRPQWVHADFAALELLQRQVLPQALQGLVEAARAVHTSSASAPPLADRLLAVAERIAEFTYYLFNGALYTRGSAAIAILSHHAMYLWLLGQSDGLAAEGRGALARHRLQALRCLPRWRAHAMPDIEASTSHTAEAYIRGPYWASFDAPQESVRSDLVECLARELRPSEAAAARGREDAQQMSRALEELRAA